MTHRQIIRYQCIRCFIDVELRKEVHNTLCLITKANVNPVAIMASPHVTPRVKSTKVKRNFRSVGSTSGLFRPLRTIPAVFARSTSAPPFYQVKYVYMYMYYI